MNVCQSKFKSKILDILEHISNAAFITFDLEMSGISINPKHDRSHDIGKPTLQQQYEEIKGAASTYQLLQLGITVVEEERQKDFYLARPYNFNLSPLSSGGIDIGLQRTICFSSSACDFLLKNKFDFGKVFEQGVPYLSREEEAELRRENSERVARLSSIPDIEMKSDDTNALEFYQDAQKTIAEWIKKPELDYVNIGTEKEKLNGFQRRLVHQLVRSEFPGYRTYSRSDGAFMQVVKIDAGQEARFQAEKLKKFEAQTAKQKGLGWIFEALCGGDLSSIDPYWLCNPHDTDPESAPASIALKIKDLNAKLQAKEHVIVGHNILMDFAFLYKTFVGTLPDSVEDFLDKIHQLFPRIIDTKFMATHNIETMQSRSSLDEVLEPLRKIKNPIILLHEDHRPAYYDFGKHHEAGFDSWMTAELFVKLSAKLNAEREKLCSLTSNAPVNTHTVSIRQASVEDRDQSNSSDKIKSDEGDIKASPNQKTHDSTDDANSIVSKNSYAGLEINETSNLAAIEVNIWLPSFSDPFWQIYFNKLRVNSIEGCVCDIAWRNIRVDDSSTRKKPRLT
ncbi:hypothetical protein K3495_g842 [Podosphaera aphanis]|nr:hypothetical protein K3495_g842 [Podosphaera aphanis]